MTLEDALISHWNGSKTKIEDLLRSGDLTFKELRIAANRSEDPHQRAIAKAVWTDYELAHARVFPQSSSQTFLTGLPDVKLTLEQAQSTPWKGATRSGEAMGRLRDEGILSLKDLAWAVESNYDLKVREAARVLLFHQLQAPVSEPESEGAAKVLKGGPSFSREKVDNTYTVGAIALGMGVGGMLALVYHRWLGASEVQMFWIFGILMVAIVPWLLMMRRTLEDHLRGADEEDLVSARFSATLDSSWIIVRNVQKKGIKGDIDLVLVGPGGVYAVEVKKWNADLRIEGDTTYFACERRRRGGYGNPVHQARKNAKALSRFLGSKGLKIPVTPVLVVSVPRLELASPSLAVWKSEDIAQEVTWLPATAKTTVVVERIAAVLEK
jgi:hypothetical protein